MCLSNVYFNNRDDGSLVGEEVLSVVDSDGSVSVKTLLGDSKEYKGYVISEVNFSENYIILSEKG